MRDALDPDHWVNGGECDHPHPDALAMEALDAEIERLKQALHDARIENSGQAAELERLMAENTLLLGQRERAMQAALWLRAYKPFAKQFKAAEAELEALEKEVQA